LARPPERAISRRRFADNFFARALPPMLAKIRATSFFFILRLLDRSGSPEKAGQRAVSMGQRTAELRPGTMLGREWNGQMHRVAVLTEGFAWNGKTYRSLTKVAFAITGTRWSGPKFFGLRDRRSKGSAP
jgi:hypothetical protein